MIPTVILPIVSCFFLFGCGYFIYQAWKEKSRARDEIARVRGQLMLKRNIGIGLLLLAVGDLLDTGVPFPFPFVGSVSVYFSALTSLVGGVMLFLYSRPKVHEILMLAERTGGYLTLVVIMIKLGLSERMVKKTMKAMLRTGMVIILNPTKTKLSEIVFLVSNFSGNPQQSQAGALAGHTDEQVRSRSQNEGDGINVDDINNMLLSGSMNLGQSGRPRRRSNL